MKCKVCHKSVMQATWQPGLWVHNDDEVTLGGGKLHVNWDHEVALDVIDVTSSIKSGL